MSRLHGRKARELRPVHITRHFTKHAAGSVLIQAGETRVLCTASYQAGVPEWREGSGLGWVTAEYDMLPASTHTRRRRNRTRVDGRTQEIQRLIGRTMRSVVDLSKLGENTIILDCDVLQADGGTRTASITGAFIALADAVAASKNDGSIRERCITDHVAAISVGIVRNQILVDLDYAEDVEAQVDLNIAMTGKGRFIEIQGTAEEATFTREQLDKMVRSGASGIRKLIALQRQALGPTKRARK